MESIVSVITRHTGLLIDEIHKLLPDLELHCVDDPESDEQLRKSHVIIGEYNYIAPYLYQLPNAKWVQGTWAGVEYLRPYIKPNNPPPYTMTRFSGDNYGSLMGEYVIAYIINSERAVFKMYDNQKESKWETNGKIIKHRTLNELVIGIMGVGTIGSKIAERLNFLGAKIIGLGRQSASDATEKNFISKYYSKSDLANFLKNCDYFINLVPDTTETRGLLDGDVLENCKERDTVFISIGRGSIISEQSLVTALEKKWLAGAILDVHEKEPLEKTSALWSMKNVIITPHISGVPRVKDIAKLFAENYKRYQNNLPVSPVFDFKKGY